MTAGMTFRQLRRRANNAGITINISNLWVNNKPYPLLQFSGGPHSGWCTTCTNLRDVEQFAKAARYLGI